MNKHRENISINKIENIFFTFSSEPVSLLAYPFCWWFNLTMRNHYLFMSCHIFIKFVFILILSFQLKEKTEDISLTVISWYKLQMSNWYCNFSVTGRSKGAWRNIKGMKEIQAINIERNLLYFKMVQSRYL